jgi:PAS domain S-box-containing protein
MGADGAGATPPAPGASRGRGEAALQSPKASRALRLQFFSLVVAIACAFSVHVGVMSVTAERKLALQRFEAQLSGLMDSWHHLLMTTHRLPYREDRPEPSWSEGVRDFGVFGARLDAFEREVEQERLLDAGLRQEVVSLLKGLRQGNPYVQDAYDQLEAFIRGNRGRPILGSTMYGILRNIGGHDFEADHLLHFFRMYQGVRDLGFSFTNLLETKQARIQGAIQGEIARLARRYTLVQVALLLFVGAALTLLLLRQVALFRHLQDSELLHRSLLTAMGEGVCLLDERGAIAAVNPAAEWIAGRPSGELLGAPLGLAQEAIDEEGTPIPPEQHPATLALRTGAAQAEVVTGIRRPGGELAWLSINAQPMASGGRARGVLLTFRDITERKRADAMLRRSEEQLRQAQKMEAIGNLAGGVAHDFNNLLTIILSNAEMLKGELQEGDPRRVNVEELREAAQRAAELTRQLLAFSRKQVLQPSVIDLNDLVTGIRRMLTRLIGEDIELVVATAQGLHPVKVDRGQLDQIIINLAVNARDAMPRGGKLIIETGNVELDEAYAAEHVGVVPGPYAMLAVTDTGEGMDPHTQARMFEPFFTTKERGKGTGLGLATVLGIVEQSGGHIGVESAPGRGTAIRIYFPRTTEDAGAASGAPETRGSAGGSETILLVEDDAHVLSIFRTVLERAGYRVLPAGGGDEALRLIERHAGPVHMVVTDMIMPGMNGRELVDRLRTARPGVGALYVSGYTGESIASHGALDHDTHFLHKPVTPEALTRKVREVLDRGAEAEGSAPRARGGGPGA